MHLNLSRFTANLPKREEYCQGYTPGLFKAIEAAHFVTNSANINWDVFTLDDAKQALEMAMVYVDCEYADDTDDHPNEGNAIHEFLHNYESIRSLKRAKPELSESVDFF